MYHRCWRWLPRFYLKALEVGVLACIIGVGVGFLGSISRLQRQGSQHVSYILELASQVLSQGSRVRGPSMYHRCWSWLPRFYLKALVVGVLACIIDVGVGFQGSISRLQRQGSQHVSYILELASQVLSQGSRGRGPSMYHRCWCWLPRFYLKALKVGVLACIIAVGVGFLGSISRLQRQGSQHVSQMLELASQVLSQGSRGRGPSMYHRYWSWLPRFYLKALEVGILACIIDIGVGFLGSISRLQRQGSQHVSQMLELASQVLSQGSRGRGPSIYNRCWSWLPRFYLQALEVGVLACIKGVGVGFLGSISRLQRQESQHVSQMLELASQVLSQGSRGRGPSMYHRCWSWLPRFYLKALEVGVLACIIGVGVGFLGSISRLQRQGSQHVSQMLELGFLGSISRLQR